MATAKSTERTMHIITVWMAQRLSCLFVILLFGTTAITYSSQALVHAYPIVAHKQPLPSSHPVLYARQDALIVSPASSTPSSPSSPPSPTPTLDTPVTVIQKPLVQIFAPNVTLFAALDVIFNSSPSSAPFPTQYPTLPPVGGPDSSNTSHIPLLLPSLSIQPSQIFHVDEDLMFGAGGQEPLTVNLLLFFPHGAVTPYYSMLSAMVPCGISNLSGLLVYRVSWPIGKKDATLTTAPPWTYQRTNHGLRLCLHRF